MRAMGMAVVVGLCIVVLDGPTHGQAAGSLAERIVGTRWRGGQVVLGFYESHGQLETNVVAVASATRVPAGIETLVHPPGFRADPLAWPRVVLTGMTLGRALDRVVAQAPRSESGSPETRYHYAWSDGNGVVHVTPLGNRRTFLDVVVPRFEVKDSTLGEALVAVHQNFDPPGQRRGVVTVSSGPGIGRPNELTKFEDPEVFTRRLSLTRPNARVRDLLDALVVANGSVCWVVRYPSLEGSYEGSYIAFVTGDYRFLTTEKRR